MSARWCWALFAAVMLAGPREPSASVQHWATHFGVEVELVNAVIEAESGWNPSAISSAGAVGLMQLMPNTAASFGVTKRFDVDENIRGGVAYLAGLLHQSGGDRRLVIAGYIAGQAYVGRRGVGFVYSDEIHRYVARVAYLYRRNRWEALLREGVLR